MAIANWKQIYDANPITSFQSTDIFYLARSPYGVGNDCAFTYNFLIPLATKGDLFTYSTVNANLGVGANSTILMADSSAATGLKWTTTTYPNTVTANQLLYASGANAVAGLATGNNGVLITSGGGVPSISSTLPSVVQTNITALGTIATGVWNGTVIGLTYGGTNAALTASNGGIIYSTATAMAVLSGDALANKILMSGASAAPTWSTARYPASTVRGDMIYADITANFTNLPGNTSPTIMYLRQVGNGIAAGDPGWFVIDGGEITGYALTKTDDTNVTLTLGGSPTNALLNATSLTLGWSGQLSLTRGGTNASLTASNGGIVYSGAAGMAILSGTATAGQMLRSGSNAAPTWSTTTFPSTGGTAGTILTSDGTNWVNTTATYPSTTVVSQLLYSSATNTIAGLATANSAVLVTNSAGVPVFSSTMTNGQIIIGSTGATPVAATITAGTGISISNGSGTITISSPDSGIAWTNVTGTTQALAVNNGYVANNAGLVTLTLPATAAIGDVIQIRGNGAGGWLIAQNASQIIHFGSSPTTTGATGSLASTNRYDCVDLTCTVANLEFVCSGVQGILTPA